MISSEGGQRIARKMAEPLGYMLWGMHGLIVERNCDMRTSISIITKENKHGKFIELTLPTTSEEGEESARGFQKMFKEARSWFEIVST